MKYKFGDSNMSKRVSLDKIPRVSVNKEWCLYLGSIHYYESRKRWNLEGERRSSKAGGKARVCCSGSQEERRIYCSKAAKQSLSQMRSSRRTQPLWKSRVPSQILLGEKMVPAGYVLDRMGGEELEIGGRYDSQFRGSSSWEQEKVACEGLKSRQMIW